jgi:hypothetical protein
MTTEASATQSVPDGKHDDAEPDHKRPYDALAQNLASWEGELLYRVSLADLQQNARDAVAARPGTAAWTGPALSMLDRAKAAHSTNRTDDARTALDESRRLATYGLEAPALNALARNVRREADAKLTSWRRIAVQELLPDTLLADEKAPSADAVATAMDLLQKQLRRRDLNESAGRLQLRIFCCYLIVSLIAVAVFVAKGWLGRGDPLSTWHSFAGVTLAGLFGGALSGVVTTARMSWQSRVSRIIGDSWAAMFRPIIGAASALVVVMVLQAGLLGDAPGETKILPVAIFAGFSDTFLVWVLDRVSRNEEAQEERKALGGAPSTR